MKYRIGEIRKNINMTQTELAEKSGCSRQFINKIENHDDINVSGVILRKIAAVLGVTVDDLFFPN